MDDAFASYKHSEEGQHIELTQDTVLDHFINEPINFELRWSIIKHCANLASNNLVSAFQGLKDIIPAFTEEECCRFLKYCCKKQVKNGNDVQYTAIIFAVLKHLPNKLLFHLLTSTDIQSDHRRYVLRFASHQPNWHGIISVVLYTDLAAYFSTIHQHHSHVQFISGLTSKQVAYIVLSMNTDSELHDNEEWRALFVALCKHITSHAWWRTVTPQQLESHDFGFAKKLMVPTSANNVIAKLWQDKHILEKFLAICILDEISIHDSLLHLERELQDAQCVIDHVISWGNKYIKTCSPANTLRVIQFLQRLCAGIGRSGDSAQSMHLHTLDNFETQVTKGSELSPLLDFIHESDTLECISNAATDSPKSTNPEATVRAIKALLDVLQTVSTRASLFGVTSALDEVVCCVYPILARNLSITLQTPELQTLYQVLQRNSQTCSYESDVPWILFVSIELLTRLVGTDMVQSCDAVAHFIQRYFEVAAQDSQRTEDAARFEQFTNSLVWVWLQFYELLTKYHEVRVAARTTGGPHKLVFPETILAFLVQVIGQPPSTEPYNPSRAAPKSTTPLRTSASSPASLAEPAYVAQHAPYVLRALIEECVKGGKPVKIHSKLFLLLVSACRQDATKWRCFKVLNFLLDEVPEVAGWIFLNSGEAEGPKAEAMKKLIGCVTSHLRQDSVYRHLSGQAFATLGSLTNNTPTLVLILLSPTLPNILLSTISNAKEFQINLRLNASTALQMLASEAATKDERVTKALKSLCERCKLAVTVTDLILTCIEAEITPKEANLLANLLDVLAVVAKFPDQVAQLVPRGAQLVNFLSNKQIISMLLNENADSVTSTCATLSLLIKSGGKVHLAAANIVSQILERFVSSPQRENAAYAESLVSVLEELVQMDTLTQLVGLNVHGNINSYLKVCQKAVGERVGNRLVNVGRQIARAARS